MTNEDFIDRLERELRAATRRRARLELARVPRVPTGATAFAITAVVCAAVALPLLAVHSRSTGVAPGRSQRFVGVVRSCGDAVSGRLPAHWSGPAIPGAISWLGLRVDGYRAAVERSHFVEGIAIVEPAQAVTISVPASERGRLALDYTSVAPRARFYLSEGTGSVTFRPCAGQRTQFDGGFIVSKPECAQIGVSPHGWWGHPIRLSIPLGRRCGLAEGPPENLLNGDGIAQAHFGQAPKSVVHELNELGVQPLSRRHFGKGECGINEELDWPGLETLFHNRRFVGYAYGPKTPDGSVSELATARGLRVGETVREARRRFYGSAFKVSAAQGGSFHVRTPHGIIDGYLSDVTKPQGKVLRIEAGHVGCPAMTP